MSKQNIFQEDVVIPDIVRTKAEKALADLPDRPVTELSPENANVKNRKKIRVAVFASLTASAALIVCGAIYWFSRGKISVPPFTISVNAQEMEDGRSLQLTCPENFLGDEIAYCDGPYYFEFPLRIDVQGEDVSFVEYSFLNSYSEVMHQGIKSDLFHGTEIKPHLEGFDIVPADNPHHYPETRYYGKYTINYPFTDKKDFTFQLITEISGREELERMYEELQPEVLSETELPDGTIRQTLEDASTPEQEAGYYSLVLENVVVTVDVYFTNGSSEKRYIGFRGAVFEEPWNTLPDGTEIVNSYSGIECYFLTDSEVEEIDFEHPLLQYEEIS